MVDFKKIEKRWQSEWEKNKVFRAIAKGKKFYNLDMFPYPSGLGLHMGHARTYTIADVNARYRRLKGYNVMYPVGYDSFGLPAENAAIKEGMHPRIYTEKAIRNFIKQQKLLGLSYDWDRLVMSHTKEYYKWDQWLFLKFFEKGLAYRKKAEVNWCEECNTVLANEQVINGYCWRHSDCRVELKELEQWFFKITKYADEMLKGLEKLEWPEKVKEMQRNWIGKSKGVLIDFKLDNEKIKVFTTRPDTLFGVTFIVFAPEHPKVMELVKGTKYESEVREFIGKVVLEEDVERVKDKKGIFIGKYAINPVNNEKVPIFVGNFVLYEYGTGVIMGVPGHDQRDFEFAKAHNIPIKEVIKGGDVSKEAYTGEGELVNSGQFSGLNSLKAIKEITRYLKKKKIGKEITQYKLRDWLISRQRYWGAPIPIVYCEDCGKENRENVLVFHGWEDNSKSGFIPGLVSNLEKKNYNSNAFDLPDTNAPKFEEWFKFAEQEIKKIDSDKLSLVGHSMGGLLALKLAEKYKLKKLILVAPVGSKPSKDYFDNVSKNLSQEELEIYKNYQNRTLNINKIKNNVKKIVFIFGGKDDWINQEIRDFYINRFKDVAEIRVLENYGHMSESEGVKKLPILEDLFEEVSGKGIVLVPEKDLPVVLPEKVDFGAGGNPLESNKNFVNVKCPKCKKDARRETDTMDTFVNSSWYFLRYCSPGSDKIFDKEARFWMPIDQYIGGAEYATSHLLYFRFFTKFMRDINLLNVDEPAIRLYTQGLVNKDGFMMSKSRGNTVDPLDMISKYGTDTLRFFLMFVSSPDKGLEWSDQGIEGSYRFLNKTYELIKKKISKNDKEILNKMHRTIKYVSENIEEFKFNNCLVKLMEHVDFLSKREVVSKESLEVLCKLLNPFCPHVTEEMWEKLGNKKYVSLAKWPSFNEKYIDDKLEYAEEFVENTRKDIQHVFNLIKKKGEVTLFVAEKWRYGFFRKLKKEIEKTRDFKVLINKFKGKKEEIVKLIQMVLRDAGRMPKVVLSQDEEVEILERNGFKVVRAEDSSEMKAKQAIPGKVGVLVS